MIYLMLLILIAAMTALLRLQHRQEQAWLKELSAYRLRTAAAAPDSTGQPENTPRNAQAADNRTVPQQAETTETQEVPNPQPAAEAPSARSENQKQPENQRQPENQTAPAQPAEQITLEEATRLLHQPIAEAATPDLFDAPNEPHKPDPELDVISAAEATRLLNDPSAPFESEIQAAFHTPEIPKETIDPNDPAIIRVRERAQAEREQLEAQVQEQILAEQAAQPLPDPHENTPHTIGLDDIQANLLRQRIARHHRQAAEAADRQNARRGLNVIPEEEVWNNLAHTDTPAARRLNAAAAAAPAETQGQPEKRSAVPPKRFTPFTNRYEFIPPVPPVYITPPVAVPDTMPREVPMPEPSFDFPPPAAAETPSWQLRPSTVPAVRRDKTATHTQPESRPVPPFSVLEEDSDNPHGNSLHIDRQPENDGDDWNTGWLEVDTGHADSAVGEEEIPEWQQWLEEESGREERSMIPPATLLAPPRHNPAAVQSEEDLLQNSITIEEKLAEFRVKVKVLDAYAGPVITRYEIEPDMGVRGNSVINLEKDLARSLGVASIRVVETIPGKTCMGLELPNPKRQTIRLRGIIESPEFADSASKLTLALGQDITGKPVVTDLAKAPHLLVAGTTGSGKSVGVNAMILSMLFKARPEDVRLIMIDPKMLELSIYEGIPHLLAPVVTDMKLAANALNWCVNEMEKRYRLMSHLGVRNLAGYNGKIAEAQAQGRRYTNPFSLSAENPEPLYKLPTIVVVVDEFADLMMTAGKQIEQLIARLTQKARAAGIHLILATQRPSVDVITGLIKANIPTRIAFQVSSKVDSRTILDQTGAENLLGQGDMLFLPPGTAYPQRVHGAFVADNEVHAVVEYLKQFGEPDYVDDILTAGTGSDDLFSNSNNTGGADSGRDPLFDQAVEVVVRSGKTSISFLQRSLRVGYNKAATLMDQLEAEGIVSSADPATGKRTIEARREGMQ